MVRPVATEMLRPHQHLYTEHFLCMSSTSPYFLLTTGVPPSFWVTVTSVSDLLIPNQKVSELNVDEENREEALLVCPGVRGQGSGVTVAHQRATNLWQKAACLVEKGGKHTHWNQSQEQDWELLSGSLGTLGELGASSVFINNPKLLENVIMERGR